MAARNYGQYCGLSRALEMVGERWGLLLVRDLLVGPRRFTELRRGLPKIPTNVLTARLKEMEAAGIVRRRVLPRPESGFEYELTEYGRDLEEAVLALGRWGAQSLGEPSPEQIVTTDSLVMALRTTFQPQAAAGRQVSFELRVGDIVCHAVVTDGAVSAAAGALEQPDLVIDSGPALRALLAGELSADEALRRGYVEVTGDPALLDVFTELFRIESPATAQHG